MLSLSLLRSFITVAEELNFRKAAQRLNITQPPLSRQIRLLEEEIGVPLLIRNRQSVNLTDAGSLLMEQARSLLAHAAESVDLVRQKGTGLAAAVRVGMSMNLEKSIHRVGIEHMKRYPHSKLFYREMASSLQNEALRRREIDVGFVRPPVAPSFVVSEPLFRQNFMVILPRRSPLAKNKRIKLCQVANEPLLLFPRKNSRGVHDKVLQLYKNAGVVPNVVYTTSSPQNAGSMDVASGKGIYVLPIGALRLDDDLAILRLDEPDATMEVHVAWRKGEKSPHILNFVDSARSIFQEGKAVPEKGRARAAGGGRTV